MATADTASLALNSVTVIVLHVAVASVHGMDYLVTWHCTHIANATMRGRLEAICRSAGFEPPIICTPIELVQEDV
jgi:hypothetical protein